MKLSIAFVGFRHGHIMDVYQRAQAHDGLDIVAACEEDPRTRQELGGSRVTITHESFDQMLSDSSADIIAIGDCYGLRGRLMIQALKADRHVISDKPICTELAELAEIEGLSRGKDRRVGCLLDLRDLANFRNLRQVIQSGRIGEVHTVDFQGQHPLDRNGRPAWYFAPGMQGGTINDIAVHAADMVPWLTGQRITDVVAARAWNCRCRPEFFQDAAQVMFRLENNGGCLGDISYLTPETFAYEVPFYWRFTLHGTEGAAETSVPAEGVKVWSLSSSEPDLVTALDRREGGYLEDLLMDIRGESVEGALTTGDVLAASRIALLAQKMADAGH